MPRYLDKPGYFALCKLCQLGDRGIVIKWTENFLRNRSQCARIGSFLSSLTESQPLRGPRLAHSERRALHKPELTQSGLATEFNNLQEREGYYVEFETKYLGNVPGVSLEADTTNRTEVLKIIDRGKNQGLIPIHHVYGHDAIFYLSKQRVKVSKYKDHKEEMLLTLQLNEIAQVCYVRDGDYEILSIKHGTPERMHLAVLHCDSQETAEAICSLINHCFHVVYTDVMIHLIEDTIDKAIIPQDPDMSPGLVSPPMPFPSSHDSPGPRPPQSDISNESSQAELLRDYMWQLNAKLRPEELMEFSTLLKNWNYNSSKLKEFCESLYQLYGPDRKYLLTGMFPFIPENDCPVFEEFLKKYDIKVIGQGTFSGFHTYPPQFYTRSISDMSIHSQTISNDQDTSGNTEDLDNDLDAMRRNLERIEQSVGDPTESYLS